jgi:hypothetical protein
MLTKFRRLAWRFYAAAGVLVVSVWLPIDAGTKAKLRETAFAAATAFAIEWCTRELGTRKSKRQ